jgi:hypothetical protein
MKQKHCMLIIGILACVLIATDTEAQCAMCKAAAESDLENNSRSIARGLNKGILFLMAAPYLIVGVIFRKELAQVLKNLKERRKQPLSKAKKEWLVFGLSVSTVWLVLFILFLRTQY